MIARKEMLWWLKVVYVLIPGQVFFEGLALQESAVMMAGTALLLLAVGLLKQKPTPVYGLLIGLVLAVGWWFKPTAVSPIGGLVAALYFYWLKHREWKPLVPVAGIATALFLLSTGILRLHPLYGVFQQVSAERGNGLSLMMREPGLAAFRLYAAFQWLVWWAGPVMVVLTMYLRRHRLNQNVVILCTGCASVLLFSLAAGEGIFTARYIAAAFPALSLCGLLLLPVGKQGRWLAGIVGVWAAGVTLLTLSRPLTAYRVMGLLPAVKADFAQYVTGWTSGWGVRGAIDTVIKESAGRNAVVLTRADSGNPESAALSYFWRKPRIHEGYVEQAGPIIALKAAGKLPEVPIYFIARGTQMAGLADSQVRLVQKFMKPLDPEYVAVYEIVGSLKTQ